MTITHSHWRDRYIHWCKLGTASHIHVHSCINVYNRVPHWFCHIKCNRKILQRSLSFQMTTKSWTLRWSSCSKSSSLKQNEEPWWVLDHTIFVLKMHKHHFLYFISRGNQSNLCLLTLVYTVISKKRHSCGWQHRGNRVHRSGWRRRSETHTLTYSSWIQ